jgi:hypothetical protein
MLLTKVANIESVTTQEGTFPDPSVKCTAVLFFEKNEPPRNMIMTR